MRKPDCTGTIAMVTGASRGVGRGIAIELGACGATVIVTGRSVSGQTTEHLPGTIEETAALVTEAGGKGIAIRCDHTKDEEVEALFRRVKEDYGRLDVLVNNVWGGYEHWDDTFTAPFWEQPLARWHGMYNAGLRAHFTASRLAAPMMITAGKGLIVTIAFVDKNGAYLGNAMYDAVKTAGARLAFGMAQDLRQYNVASIALYPGFTRTERVLKTVEGTDFDYSVTQSPQYAGRAVAALATDAGMMSKSGRGFHVGDLAKEYGFVDIDGRQPEAFVI